MDILAFYVPEIPSWVGWLMIVVAGVSFGLFTMAIKTIADLRKDYKLLSVNYRREEKRILAMKRHEESDRRRLLEALDDFFLIVDKDHEVFVANKIAHDMLRADVLEGQKLEDASRNPALEQEINEGLKSILPYQKEIVIPYFGIEEGETKTELVCLLEIAPVYGNIDYKRVIIRDITEQHQTQQIRKDFVANASHELRTPLTIIVGYLESLTEEGFIESCPQMAHKFLHTMYKHSRRLQRLVDDMLMLSKLESNKADLLKIAPFSFKECVEDVFSRLEFLAEKKNAELVLNIEGASDFVLKGDQFYWTQIIFNLVENALKQNFKSDLRVEVGARLADMHLEIWTKDNGVGIPSSHLPYIFKRFYRVETHHSSEIKGTGLGLSIVKNSVEAHHGSIKVMSTPDEETRFTILLPRDILSEG